MAPLRRVGPLLIGAFLAAACDDPQPTTGSLLVSVTGLPAGANGAVRVLGPNSFFQFVRTTTTLENLVPGDYILVKDPVMLTNARYAVDSADVRDTVAVTRGNTESVSAAYEVASGSLNVAISGLPEGIGAQTVVQGPLDELPFLTNQIVTASTTLGFLKPGDYRVIADSMTAFTGDKFVGAPPTDTISVVASLTPAQANVTYSAASGALSVTVTGLPQSITNQPVRITGPNGYDIRTTQSVVLRGLAAGTYNITAANVATTCPNTYATNDSQQSRDVAIGQTSTASITYAEGQVSPADLNLTIDKAYLTQATQNSDGTVPLIAGKTALVRVFGAANQCNTAKPKVRVTLSTGLEFVIDPQEDSVRLVQDESQLATTWNVVVPGSAIQAGMTIVAEMDPTSLVTEANETDNRLPPTGAKAITVHAPVVGLRLVPITQSVNGLTGNVNPGNLDAWMDFSRKLHPVGTYNVDIRDPYTTSAQALGSNGQNWVAILSEIRSLQESEGSFRYYYGVAKTSYNSGVAGIAFVPGKAGMGWDFLPSASRVMAHELGHNFNRQHSPCGGPAGIDANYPNTGLYSGGRVGTHGWDPIDGFKAADVFTDVMGYCSNQWISDYTYVGMLDWLLSRPPSLPTTASTSEQPSLLIWGRIENGQPVLEPAFEISARPRLVSPGPHRVTATDASGAELFNVSFAGERIADLPSENETFSFTVPLSALRGRNLASLKLIARGKTVSSVASADVGADPTFAVTRAGPNAARIRWDAARFPVVMVRDPVKGHVLSFARGGDVTIKTARTELELNYSNRVRSSRRLTQF